MKNFPIFESIRTLTALAFLLLFFGCEKRELNDLQSATFNSDGSVFIDGFSPGLDYGAFGNSYLKGFNVDEKVSYKGTASMRFDVPNVGDPEGAYVGGVYIDSTGRDLSGYDALTFWAKASQTGTINEIGFGNHFGENKYVVTLSNLQLSTYWKQFTIPLPDPSKLKRSKGLFWYSEGPEDGKGYSFWIDEVKYEKLGDIKKMSASIFGGDSIVQTNFVGNKIPISGLNQVSNLGTGQNVSTTIAPAFFNFSSSNPDVASVDEFGNVEIKAVGTAKITATLGGFPAKGSMTINAIGFTAAPTPTQDPVDVISLFSDAYTNVNVDYFNGYWAPWQTTKSVEININGDRVISYTDFNFVGIEFKNPTIDASQMAFLHMDVYFEDPVVPETALYVDLLNEATPTNIRGSKKFDSTVLISKQWNGLEIPVSIISQNNKVFQIILNAPANLIKGMYVDNIYFHK
jgi:hypothetical protein